MKNKNNQDRAAGVSLEFLKSKGSAFALPSIAIITALLMAVIPPFVALGNIDKTRAEGVVNKQLLKKADAIVNDLKQLGIKSRIIETYRTQERQNYLYASGRTRKGRILTYAKVSKHTLGQAFDIALFDKDGKLFTNTKDYKVLMQFSDKYDLVWGGNWKMQDCMHFETRGGSK